MSGAKWATGSDRQLIRRAMQAPLLSREQELALARGWHDNADHAALSELIEAYLRLVISVAARYRHYGLPAADLIQEGTVGLMEAAARFDPDREVRFSTYASWWIRAAIQDFVLRNWSIVRTGTTAAHKALFFNLKRLKSKILNEGDTPLGASDREKIADAMGVKLRDVEAMEGRLSGVDRSLNAPIADDSEQEWQDLLVSERPTPEADVIEDNTVAHRNALIESALDTLSDREAYIIRLRRLSEETATLASLGEELGISKERVRQLELAALNKLRGAILRNVGAREAADLKSGNF